MTDYGGFVNVSYSNSFYFTNASNNDMLIYPETSNQTIHLGITSNSQSIMTITSNAALFNNGNIGINSNIFSAGLPNRIWDFSGTIADGYGEPGYVSKSYITGSNITVSTLTPFSNLNTEGSIYLQGIAGNYITVVPKPATAALPDTTVETWIYQGANPGNANGIVPYLIGNIATGAGPIYWSFGINPANQLAFYANAIGPTSAIVSSTTIVNNTWNHIAFSYSSNSKILYMFLNGVIQTLTATGLSGNGTTAITFTNGASNVAGTPIVIGQHNSVSLSNTYISNFRYINAALYTSTFTPSIYPLQTYSNSTQLLLRAPLYNPIVHLNAMHTHDSMRAHCLPTDAMIYADCYGTNQPNLSGSFTPTFDSNITKSIVFNRANGNYLAFPPQTFNITTKGFTAITKFMFTGTPVDWEFIFFAGNGANDNNTWLARTASTPQLTFGFSSNNATASVNNNATPVNMSINQATIFTCISRYDPFTNGGTTTIWYNGSNVYSLNAMSGLIGTDRTINNLFIGRNLAGSFLNANIYNFAVYNRALTDKEITDASAALMAEPSLPNKSTVEIGSASGKPALTVQQDGTIQIAGPISTNNNLSYSPVDYGVSNFSIPGSIVGTVPAVAMTPFNTTTEGSLFVQGLSGNYISIPNNIFNTKWNNGFTCEAWVNYPTFANVSPSVYSSVPSTMGAIDSTNTDWSLGANSSSNITFAYYTTIWNNVSGTSTMQPNTWYHIAVTYDGTNIRIFQNGILQNTPIAIVGTPRNIVSNFSIAGSSANLGGGGGVANMYITNARVVYGSALYTANFTPPTGPLAPAATGTTALLLRAPQNPGRVLIPKIGGTTQVQEYPPAAMTANLTNIQNVSYGAGIYIASASSIFSSGIYPSYNVFDKNITTQWSHIGVVYTTIGDYAGSVSTVDINGNAYKGEWIQLQMPSSINLSSYSLLPYTDSNWAVKKFFLLGSTDGVKWTLLNTQSGLSGVSLISVNTNINNAYNYYRLVSNSLQGIAGVNAIMEIIFYGTEESISITPDGQVGIGVTQPKQQLEVAGNAIINGNISANNIGMFRNRIINGDMRISQRGTSFSTTTSAYSYTLDRFRIPSNVNTGNLTVTQSTNAPVGFSYSLQCTIVTASAYIEHCIEQVNLSDCVQGTVMTLSFYAYMTGTNNNLSCQLFCPSSTNGFTPFNMYALGYGTSTAITLSSVWQRYSMQIYISDNNLSQRGGLVHFWGLANTSLFITGVQLEKGTIATPFEFRPLAMELQLCQRYFFQLSGFNYQVLATTFPSNNTTSADAYIPTRVTMRTTPSALTNSAMSTFNIGPATALSSFSIGTDSTPDLIRLMQNGTFTNNIYASGVYLRAAADQTAYLGFSAEL